MNFSSSKNHCDQNHQKDSETIQVNIVHFYFEIISVSVLFNLQKLNLNFLLSSSLSLSTSFLKTLSSSRSFFSSLFLSIFETFDHQSNSLHFTYFDFNHCVDQVLNLFKAHITHSRSLFTTDIFTKKNSHFIFSKKNSHFIIIEEELHFIHNQITMTT